MIDEAIYLTAVVVERISARYNSESFYKRDENLWTEKFFILITPHPLNLFERRAQGGE